MTKPLRAHTLNMFARFYSKYTFLHKEVKYWAIKKGNIINIFHKSHFISGLMYHSLDWTLIFFWITFPYQNTLIPVCMKGFHHSTQRAIGCANYIQSTCCILSFNHFYVCRQFLDNFPHSHMEEEQKTYSKWTTVLFGVHCHIKHWIL